MAKRFNRIAAVALSVAMLTTSTAGFFPEATAENAIPDVSTWQYAVAEDFEALELGTAYPNWGSYCKNVMDSVKADVGAGNSKGVYVYSTSEADGSAYSQPFYYVAKEADFAGATEFWMWYDFSNYESPVELKIRPRLEVNGVQADIKMIGNAPIYFQTGDGFRASTLTNPPEDDLEAECAIRAEDMVDFKGYIRIPLSSFRSDSGQPFTNTGITKFVGGYWISDFTFVVNDDEEFVENGYVMDNFLLVGPTVTGGAAVSDLFGGSVSDEDKAAASAVTAKIAALPATITLNNKDAVVAARQAYNALSADAKALVENFSTLTTAEAAIKALEDTASITDEMKAAASAAVAAIAALPSEDNLTINDKAAVEAARAAYDKVAEVARSLVTNYKTLTKAEEKMLAIVAADAAAQADKVAAQSVSDLIKDLPATVRPSDQAAITAARKAYDALTDVQKALVANYSNLEAAEKQLSVFTNRSPEDPDPSWQYLSLADFENLSNGYKFNSEKDTESTSQTSFKYMNEPTGARGKYFETLITKNGFKGSNAMTVSGIAGDTKGSYAQPLLRVDQLNNSQFKDYSGAEEMVVYMDFSHIKMDGVGMQFRFMENDMDASGATTGKITQWGLKADAFVYIQDSKGKWIKVYNNKSEYEASEFKLPVEVVGRVEYPVDTTYPNGLKEVAGYKGMVRIPLSQLKEVEAGANLNSKMDLKQVTQLWMVFNFPNDQDTSYYSMDQFGFVGNFTKTGQGETSVLDVLSMSATVKDDTTKPGGASTGDSTAACVSFGAIAITSFAVCVKFRRSRKHK